MPSTTLLDIPPAEQAQMRAIHRRARYGSLLARPDRLCAVPRLSARLTRLTTRVHGAGLR